MNEKLSRIGNIDLNKIKSTIKILIGLLLIGVLMVIAIGSLPETPTLHEAYNQVLEQYPECEGNLRIDIDDYAVVGITGNGTKVISYYLICESADVSIKFYVK
jgi:hypothetical protein